MSEQGTVVNVNGNMATVEMIRTEACAKCKACIAGLSEKKMYFEAENDVMAEVGDIVAIELSAQGFLNATIIMYVFPLLMTMAGFAIGWFFAPFLPFNKDLFIFFVGIIFMVISFLIIRLNEGKIKDRQKYMPVITKKL